MCATPLNLGDRIVSCGQCIDCLIKRSQEWAFRLEHEAKTAISGVFLTLTYSDENAIWIDNEDETLTTLSKSDVQKFIKRLRKFDNKFNNHKVIKVRYFIAGEYGPSTQRAHYHCIIFNANRKTIEALPKIWGKGHVDIQDVTPKSIRYTTNYMALKEEVKAEHQQKPFTLMSKKPILGANYVVKNYYHHHESQDHKLVSPTLQRRNLYRTLEKKIFTPEELLDIRKTKLQELDKWKEEENQRLEEQYPLDPLGGQKDERQHKAKIRKSRLKRKRNKL